MIKALVHRFYAELWEAGDESAAPAILHVDLRFRGSLGDEKQGIAGYLDYLRSVRAGLSNYRCEILSLVAEGDRAAAEMRFSGQHTGLFQGVTPTGRELAWEGSAFFTLYEERLARIWVLGDLDALRKQLGTTA